jgi:hypothetical protein
MTFTYVSFFVPHVEALTTRLNEHAKNGFKFVSITTTPNGGVLVIMEREITETPA